MSESSSSRELRIEALLDLWEEACEKGAEPDLELLCRDAPELLETVRRRIDALRQVDRRWFGDQTEPHRQLTATSELGEEAAELASGITVSATYGDPQFVGKGGLGVVYAATDHELHRKVALKFMQPQEAIDPAQRRRFELEAEITSRLDHPGVVPVYGIGASRRQRPFYVMRYIRGQDLDSAIAELHLPPMPPGGTRTGSQADQESDTGNDRSTSYFARRGPTPKARKRRELLVHFVSVCKTIAYAHRRGVVHGDLKPHNVMLGRYGETLVVDWGQAIVLDRPRDPRTAGEFTELRPSRQDAQSTGSDRISPAYMSPEQARGDRPGPESDVYSLGATLFKLLTGRTAASGSLVDIRERVLQGDLPRARSLASDVPRALDAICAQAMALRPEDRYGSAMALAEDIERYLADEPVNAYPEPTREKIARWMRKHRTSVFSIVILILALVALSWLTTLRFGVAARNESLAREDTELHRRRNLAISAVFLAEAIANEIDLRWRILEAEASSPKLQELVAQLNAQPEDPQLRTQLQAWLDGRCLEHKSLTWKSWFINTADGTQQARAPRSSSRTIGRNFKHRDYFHGKGKDLNPDELEGQTIEILGGRPAHMSAVFFSDNTFKPMVCFSVPVLARTPDGELGDPIGLIAMTIEVGDFQLPSEVRLLLVDSRPDQFEGRPGMILHAPGRDLALERKLPPRLDAETLAQARLTRSGNDSRGELTSIDSRRILSDFVDPITGDPALVAVASVRVEGRDESIADTGLIVVVEDASAGNPRP